VSVKRAVSLEKATSYLCSLTTGNVKVPPDATVAGRPAAEAWKSFEAMLGLGLEIAAFAVQVTWTVEACET
jgi:hypothetical protein